MLKFDTIQLKNVKKMGKKYSSDYYNMVKMKLNWIIVLGID